MTLIDWFLFNRRSFPWRKEPTPYHVWVSEVMLQQTRASVVVPYFERWLDLFPDVKSLALAPIEQVIKAWEGLGYYSRARNLHRGARHVLSHHGGNLPSNFAELLEIPGIGRYTAAAILSFGFHQKALPVDGNVARVVARYAWIDQPVDKAAGRLVVEERGMELLDIHRPWISAEALIELGATICTPTKPKCDECPLQASCVAVTKNAAEALPILSPRPVVTQLIRGVAIIQSQELVLLRKNPTEMLMGDLYEFPIFEGVKSGRAVEKLASEWCKQKLKLIAKWRPVSHTFTRYRAHLYPFQFLTDTPIPITDHDWIPIDQLDTLPFSSGHRKLLPNVKPLYMT